jgi:SAM-dependent methyltransferase
MAARRSLLDLLSRVRRRAYDSMDRRGAPWESGPRPELVELVESGRVRPGRAIDLGCGSGADSVFLAGNGFDVTGVDLSPVAVEKAGAAVAAAGVEA